MPDNRSNVAAFGSGTAIGTLGGLIGLGGAEFRLPLLISLFRFHGLEAVILNKAVSLVVVISAMLFRAQTVSLDQMAMCWPICATLLTGSLIGAWLGADWATRLRSETLHRVIAVLLVLVAAALIFAHSPNEPAPVFTGWVQLVIGVTVGFVIGVIASLLGVAGGEFLIPTIVLLFGQELKLAGSLSLAVSLPTMLVGFTRYSRDQSFSVIRHNRTFLLVMAAGSIVGTFIGGLLLGLVSNAVLLPLLAALLVVSAVKVWPSRLYAQESQTSNPPPQPPTDDYSISIWQTVCPKCSGTMLLTRIAPDAPGNRMRTFQCPDCKHTLSRLASES